MAVPHRVVCWRPVRAAPRVRPFMARSSSDAWTDRVELNHASGRWVNPTLGLLGMMLLGVSTSACLCGCVSLPLGWKPRVGRAGSRGESFQAASQKPPPPAESTPSSSPTLAVGRFCPGCPGGGEAVSPVGLGSHLPEDWRRQAFLNVFIINHFYIFFGEMCIRAPCPL